MEQISPMIRESINKIIKEQGYVTQKVEVHKFDGDGASYQGVLYKITITGETMNGDNETSIFIKHLIENYESFKLYPVLEVYRREAFVYNELANIFRDLEDSAHVPYIERFKIVKSYNCSSEAIILEDIAKHGYKTIPRFDVIPLKLAELSIGQIAKFHALTFVLKVKRPEYFNNKIKPIKQCMVFDELYRDFMTKMFNISLDLLDSERRKKVADFYPTIVEEFPKYVRGEKTKTKCLIHGDYRISNVMMKEIDDNITEVACIDYQQLYYGSPLLDFIYFTFAATDRQFRKDHLNHLKDFYFNTLQNYLNYFNVDVSDVYPRDEFERDFKVCLKYGLMVAMYFMPFFFVQEDDSPDLNEELMGLTLNLHPVFKDRLRGIIDDFVEWGYL